MKILYLHQYFLTPEQGGGTRSYEMGRRWVEAGHQVSVVTSDQRRSTRAWRSEEIAGMQVHRIGVPYDNRLSYARRMQAFAAFARACGRKAAEIGGDVVFATSTPLTIALPAIYVSKRRSIPFVFEVRDLWPEIPIAIGALRNPFLLSAARQLERIAYENARHVVALSSGMREGVVRAGKHPRDVSVVPNSCDLEQFGVDGEVGRAFRSAYDWLGDRPLVVYAGTLGRANGVGYLARVAAACRKRMPTLRFLVVGEGAERQSIERLAGELGVLGDNFFMQRAMPKSEVPALLSAADLACSLFIDEPALRHNSANKFFDALAASRPVAVNHRGWIPELIEAKGCGVQLGSDATQGARRLMDYMRDREGLKAAGRRARQLGEAQFDRAQLAMQVEARLREAVHA